MPKNWKLSHDPSADPRGCNGKPGTSGVKVHRRKGEPTCDLCRAAEAHYHRELRREQKRGRQLWPCGTWQAAARHHRRGEPVDFKCRVARAEYKRRNRERAKARAAAATAAA